MDLRRLAANWAILRERVERAAARSASPRAPVTLISVTKTVPAEAVAALHALGARDFGENRVMAGLEKKRACAFAETGPDAVRWHLIGHVQTNKAKMAVAFPAIHSVDSTRVADALERHAMAAGRSIDVWLEINIASEASKQGAAEGDIPELARALERASRLRWRGLMAKAPLAADPESSRPVFRRLREWRDRLMAQRPPGAPPLGLSMGMSGDFEVAIEEGASCVRVGTAIWEGVFG